MGNTIYSSSSQPTDMKSLASHIDDIAVHYILKQNTIDLLRLTDKEYYDNLIVLVGNLFEKRLSDLEIGTLNQRIFPETIQEAVLNMLPSNGKIKDMMISNISKFYIKIMMIFSAIVSTIDPQYSYDDDTGKKQLFYLKDIKSYKNIPKNVQPVVHQLTNPMNLCRKRISILRNKIDSTDPDFITINPGEKLCSTESSAYLTDEIGIKELDLLYYDVFDSETKTWKGRTKEMDDKYREDLKKFYTIFTGKSELPQNITSFKDIELFDFRSMDYCRDSLFTHDFIIPKDNELIIRYKEQVDLLEQSTTIYRAELLETLKKIFLTKIENENMSYTIQSSLTLQDILTIENETRNTIINLYTNCEQYFIRALLIFEELYDNQSKTMNESRINNIDVGFPTNVINPINATNVINATNSKNIPLYKEGLINVNTVPQPMPPLNMTPNVPMNMKSNSTPNGFNMTPEPIVTSSPMLTPPEPSPQPMSIPEPVPNVTPEPQPMSIPEPVPNVTPEPVPNMTPEPVPNVTPEPVPNMTPEPVPNMTPEPVPNMTPEPVPNMTPEPVPNMTPEPVPNVTPEPVPNMTPAPVPNVTPEPVPNVTPEPVPNVTPEPVPNVTPEPVPNMTPEPVPNVTPEPVPNMTPEPVPNVTPEPVPAQSSNAIKPEEKPGLMDSIRKILG
jgi:hypothetical protein